MSPAMELAVLALVVSGLAVIVAPACLLWHVMPHNGWWVVASVAAGYLAHIAWVLSLLAVFRREGPL